MQSSVSEEVSTLFEELIVSKIKTEIQALKDNILQLSESSEDISQEIKKIPKNSLIKSTIQKEMESAVNDITHMLNKQKIEKNLDDIVKYLKQQYAFENESTLAHYLHIKSAEILEKVGEEIENSEKVFDKSAEIGQAVEDIKQKTVILSKGIEKKIDDLSDNIEKQLSVGSEQKLSEFMEAEMKAVHGEAAQMIENTKEWKDVNIELKDLKTTLKDFNTEMIQKYDSMMDSACCILESLKHLERLVEIVRSLEHVEEKEKEIFETLAEDRNNNLELKNQVSLIMNQLDEEKQNQYLQVISDQNSKLLREQQVSFMKIVYLLIGSNLMALGGIIALICMNL